jgi:Glycosyltransferase sugar-binding region containing DXD motif
MQTSSSNNNKIQDAFGNRMDEHEQERQHTLESRRLQTILQNNPEWKLRMWTDDECSDLLRIHFADYSFITSHFRDHHTRSKLWDVVSRIAILYVHGGIFLDRDVECRDGVSFQDWLAVRAIDDNNNSTAKDSTQLLLAPAEKTRSRKQLAMVGSHALSRGYYFVGSVPGHPFWLHYMQTIETVVSYKNSSSVALEHVSWSRILTHSLHSYMNKELRQKQRQELSPQVAAGGIRLLTPREMGVDRNGNISQCGQWSTAQAASTHEAQKQEVS